MSEAPGQGNPGAFTVGGHTAVMESIDPAAVRRLVVGEQKVCSNGWPLDGQGEHIGCGVEYACHMGECCCHDDGEDC